jgi:hypothetical protein
LTESGPCSLTSPTSTTSTILCSVGQDSSDGNGSPCESLHGEENMSPVLPEVQNMPDSWTERGESRLEPVNGLRKEDIRPMARGMEPIPLL